MKTLDQLLASTAPIPTTALANTGDHVHLTTAQLRKRYGDVVSRTIDRWVADERLKFPRPLMINRRRYWILREIEAWERARAAQAA